MCTVALTYAEAHFSQLTERAAQGEEIIVTRHDSPLIKLIPASRLSREEVKSLFAEIDTIRKGTHPGEDPSMEQCGFRPNLWV